MSTPAQAWKNDPSYEDVHKLRFDLSLAALKPYLVAHDRLLSLGDSGTFERSLIEQRLVDIIESYSGDLRYPFDDGVDTGKFNVVLCMEVFEHIHDQECDKPTEWRATGTANLLRETFRVLKPGGILFLTTPNACSINVLEKVMTMQAPMVYRPHVREYAPAEIDALIRGAGFRIESFVTHDCWGGGCLPARRRLLEKLLADGACPSPHRGEDIFVIARKP